MEYFVLVATVFAVGLNTLLGAYIWSAIDYKDLRLLAWFSKFGSVRQFLLLNGWPIALVARATGRI